VREIRKDVTSTDAYLAHCLGVDRKTVKNVRTGITWKSC
jgi:DNA-binding XRE family transcriptional regulator